MNEFEKETIIENEISESPSVASMENFVGMLGTNEEIEEILRKMEEEETNQKELNLPPQEFVDELNL